MYVNSKRLLLLLLLSNRNVSSKLQIKKCSTKNLIKMPTTLTRKIVSSDKIPKPLAPYSQAVIADRTVYVSGCLGIDPATNQLVAGGTSKQTIQALANLTTVLEAAGSSISSVIKCTVFVQDISEFAIINEEYKKVFTHDFPARSCVQVAKLPMNGMIEIEAIALTGDVKTVAI